MSNPIIEHVECTSVSDFLNRIEMANQASALPFETLGYYPIGPLIHRGQGDASFPLVPTALRENAFSDFSAQVFDPKNKEICNKGQHELVQVRNEQRLLYHFCEAVDKVGMELPEDSQSFRDLLYLIQNRLFPLGDATPYLGGPWPVTEFLTAFALMQHYLIPTRLLDWSQSFEVAAYFAASSAIRKLKNSTEKKGELGVFSLNAHILEHDRRSQDQDATKRPVQIVSAPYFSNPNLRAQRGIFTVHRIDYVEQNKPVTRSPIDEIISGYLKVKYEADNPLYKLPVLTHFRLPWTEAPKLLMTLAGRGITASEIFPGYKSIGTSFKERSTWQGKL